MKLYKSALLLSLALPLVGCANAEAQDCAPAGYTMESLAETKNNEFSNLDAQTKGDMAIALTACLGDPDPDIRDGLAYEGLTTLLRSGDIETEHLDQVRERLLTQLNSEDAAGFMPPFAALVLAEVSRTDRVAQYMSDETFDNLVTAASDYVKSVED